MDARWLAMGLLLLAVGCGGSSGGDAGGGGSTTDAFVGDYGFTAFLGTEAGAYRQPRTTARADWGTVTADGAGTWDLTGVTSNAEGGVQDSIILSSPSPYRFDEVLGLVRGPNLMGPLRSGGAVGAAILLTPPGVQVFARLDGPLEPGEYGLVMFGYAAGSDIAFWGTLTVAPGGTLTNVVLSSNANGTLTLDVALADGAWTSTADGSITLGIGMLELAGFAGAGSQVAVLGGHTVDGTNFQVVGALARLAGGATAARFDGEYAGVKLFGPLTGGSAPAWSANLGRLRADGAGSYQEQFGIGSTDGRYDPGGTSFGTDLAYTVASNGALTVLRQVGFVSADGRTVLLAGNVDGRLAPSIGIFVR